MHNTYSAQSCQNDFPTVLVTQDWVTQTWLLHFCRLMFRKLHFWNLYPPEQLVLYLQASSLAKRQLFPQNTTERKTVLISVALRVQLAAVWFPSGQNIHYVNQNIFCRNVWWHKMFQLSKTSMVDVNKWLRGLQSLGTAERKKLVTLSLGVEFWEM